MSADAAAHVVFVKDARFPSFPLVEERMPAPPPRAPNAEAEAIREAARRDGLARGREEGRAAALEEWSPRLAALAAALEEALRVARVERERLASELDGLVPRVTLDLAEKIVGRELADAAAALATVVEMVTRRLTEPAACVVRVAPAVAEAFEVWRTHARAPMLASVTVRSDPALANGDWIVESEHGMVDGRLATQFAEAARILTEAGA